MATTSSKSTPTARFSSNYNPVKGHEELDKLLITGKEGGRWTLTTSGLGIERGFKFKTFKKTWEFMNVIAGECKVQKHHPEWSNSYNTTFIRWTTHTPLGISEKDILMARFCDEKAGEFGEIVPKPEPGKEGEGKEGGEEKDEGKFKDCGCGDGGDGEKGREVVDRVLGEDGKV